MRSIVISILLFISVVVAEDVVAGKVVNPAETAETAEEAGIDETANINLVINEQPQAYESPRFKKFVTHCSSHVAETCSENDPMRGKLGLSLCLFDSMEACLVDHKASLYQTTSSYKSQKSIQYLPVLIETVKFQAVLRTCSKVTAQTCFTTSDVNTSTLSACLKPYLIRCVYLDQDPPPSPPSMIYFVIYFSSKSYIIFSSPSSSRIFC